MPIIGPLPQTFADGGLGEASQVMANYQWIVDQVNANATLGGNQGQWTLYGATPTYVNTFAFSIPGDQRSLFYVGRAFQVVAVNGTITGIAAVVSFGAGKTTVTLNLNNSPIVFLAPLISVSYSMIDGINSSLPATTNFQTFYNFTVLPSSSLPLVAQQAVALGDVLGEWFITGPLGGAQFVAKQPGKYLFVARGWLDANGANVTNISEFQMSYRLNFGGTSNALMSHLSWPFATGIQSNKFPFSGQMAIALNAGDQMGIFIRTPVFGSGSMLWAGSLAVRRLPY